jgi:hypothetical protein
MLVRQCESRVRVLDKLGKQSDSVSKLRAQAQRYRLLGETSFHPDIAAVVLDCARDLETEAKALEQGAAPGPRQLSKTG